MSIKDFFHRKNSDDMYVQEKDSIKKNYLRIETDAIGTAWYVFPMLCNSNSDGGTVITMTCKVKEQPIIPGVHELVVRGEKFLIGLDLEQLKYDKNYYNFLSNIIINMPIKNTNESHNYLGTIINDGGNLSLVFDDRIRQWSEQQPYMLNRNQEHKEALIENIRLKEQEIYILREQIESLSNKLQQAYIDENKSRDELYNKYNIRYDDLNVQNDYYSGRSK